MSDVSTQAFWQSLYEKGRTGWDLGGPTPVFRRIAEGERFQPGRMIVVGAGRGYDARLFARHGYQVTAVDFAPAAIRELRARNDPLAPVVVIDADIFDLNSIFFGGFDYVLEYTFYCAIDPQRRPEYAAVVSQLLAPGGHFMALAFPIGEQEGGPPFAVDADELIGLLEDKGLRLEHRETPPDSVAGRRGREELLILQKEPQRGFAGGLTD